MKNLLTITVLVSFLSVSSFAVTSDHMSLYKETIPRSDTAGELYGGYVEKDFMDFYIEPIAPVKRQERPSPVFIAKRQEADSASPGEYINVFGVKVPLKI